MELQRPATDSERERSVAALERALGEGRITVPEFEERVEAAFTALTRADLDALTADLSTRAVVDRRAPVDRLVRPDRNVPADS